MNLSLIVLKTDNVAGLVSFYSKLGLTFEEHQHGKGPVHFAAEINETVFEIYPLAKGGARPDDTTRIGFAIKNLDRMVLGLEKEGVIIISQPKWRAWGYTAVVEGIDGRRIELTNIEN